MNTNDKDKNSNCFDNLKKTEVKQKCFDKTYKVGNKFSLEKNKGYDI